MTARTLVAQVLDQLGDDDLNQVLDYARYLILREEREKWQQFSREQLAKAYGDDEPDYVLGDLQKDNPS
jgi:hypothetical protein